MNWLMVLILFCAVHLPLWGYAASPTLHVSDSGTGVDRKVTVESTGQFRLIFDAGFNWGISQWYDLVNDPNATTNLSSEAFSNPQYYSDESGLYNQVWYGTNLDDQKLVIQSARVYPNAAAYRSFSILENTINRVVVQSVSNPLIADTAVNDIRATITYYIYPTGKIFLHSKVDIFADFPNTSWRQPTIGLSDPSITDTHSEPDTAGWMRSTATQSPYSYENKKSPYIFAFWSPETPAPYTNWTKASIMVVPKADNPYETSQHLGHNWNGFKRMSYYAQNFVLSKGQTVESYYLIQLGTQGSSLLPNITNASVAGPYANDYLNPSALTITTGTIVGTGYDATEGAYTLSTAANQAQFSINGSIYKRIKPVFKISGYNSTKEPIIVVDGQTKIVGVDFIASLASPNTLLVQLNSDITKSTTISITEGIAELPVPAADIQAPTTPTGLVAMAASTTQINLSWNASTDNKGVAGYKIYRDGVPISSQSGTSYSDTGMTEGVIYTYNIAAYDVAGNISAQSSPVTAKTQTVAPQVTIARKAYGILDYNSNTTDTILGWIRDRFVFKVAGKTPSSSSVHWDTYFDIYGPASVAGLLSLKDWALANNVNAEEILLHAKVDYTSAIATAWDQLDKFDAFEGAKGVMRTSDDVTYTDLTSTAYSGTITWQNTMYVGYEEPFDQINLVFSTAGSGITRVWEYWNGSAWSTLTTSGSASGLTATGQVLFTPPATWARKVVNGSRSKFFVRCRITAASTNPVTSSVKGDNWLRGGGNLCRGWDATSGSIINTGALAYNPSPPAGASAKFPYQARISYWAANHFVANPADFQLIGGNTVRTWAKFVASVINNMVATEGYTGVMCDDGERDVISDGIASVNTDFVNKSANPWLTESINKYGDIVAYTHALNPAIKVGINAQDKSIVIKGDWNLAEYHSSNWKTNSPRGIPVSDNATVMNYDDYLPANNPKGIIGLIIYQDTEDVVPGKTVTWDRSNRGPMVALSKHYIAMNDYTIFSYYSQGGFVYSETDEIFLKDKSVRHQSTDPMPTVEFVSRWATYFPAMGVDIGTPDVTGYNGGVRSFTWKSHTEIGGVQDVWRRDFTQAVVLHRPASWDTTDSEYNTYSTPIDLGGTYYPLIADGTTGTGITSIALRTGEGVILLKSPTTTSPSPPPIIPPPPPMQPASPKNLMIVK